MNKEIFCHNSDQFCPLFVPSPCGRGIPYSSPFAAFRENQLHPVLASFLQSCAINATILVMRVGQRKPTILIQLLLAVALCIAGFMAIGLSHNNTNLQKALLVKQTVQAEYDHEQAISAELQATRNYIETDQYLEQYNREEANKQLQGERRVVVVAIEATPMPTLEPTPVADPAESVLPWQMWWELLWDAPQPTSK